MAEEHVDGAVPQEDINDKLLLDLAWEKQQKKVNERHELWSASLLGICILEQVVTVCQFTFKVPLLALL